jgi:hypothetical protein
MVFSLLPVSLVGAEEAAKMADYTMFMQKAHNQTEGSLAIDIYLQASAVSEVTGYQLDVIPAEGLTLTGVVDNTGNDNLKASGGTIIYDPAGLKPITVGTVRVLVATVTVTGETLPAQAGDAITVTEAQVTTAEAQFAPTVTAVAVNNAWADVTGQWKPLTQADLDALYNKDSRVYFLDSGNYYLTEDISSTAYYNIKSGTNCIHLNGHNMNSSTLAIRIGNATLNMMGNGKVTGSFKDATSKYGSTIYLQNVEAKLNLYGGSLTGHTVAFVPRRNGSFFSDSSPSRMTSVPSAYVSVMRSKRPTTSGCCFGPM